MTKIRDLIHWNRPSLIPVDYRDSFSRSLASLQEDMNRMFDHVYNSASVYATDWSDEAPSAPAVNIIEKDDAFQIESALAGMDPKDVEVEITDGFLTIKGERGEKKEEKDEKGDYLRRELSFGSFLRTVALPETADFDKAEASFRNGILTITVKKKAAAIAKPKKVAVKQAA